MTTTMTADTLAALVPVPFRALVSDAVTLTYKERSLQRSELDETLRYFTKGKTAKAVRKTVDKWQDGLFGESYRVNARGRPDDAVYKAHPVLQERLTRGFTVIRRHDETLGVLVSFRKFYGHSIGDDDDGAYGTAVSAQARSFIITEKANGECAHVYWLASEKAWIVGSKNRKMLVRAESDVERHIGEEYQFARPIADAWFALLKQIGPDKVAALQQFLTETELTLTFEAERVEHQHIVLLEETRLVLIGLTSIMQPTGLHPAVTYAVARFFDDAMHCVAGDLGEYPMSDAEKTCARIASLRWDVEGCVLYFLDEKKRVVDMKKVKSQRYVWQRAVREKIGSHLDDKAVLRCRERTSRRMQELERDMKWPQPLVERFERIALAFIDWFFLFKVAEEGETAVDQFVHRYPTLWREFMPDDTLSTQQRLLATPMSDLPLPRDLKAAMLVLPQGIPGIGKNYVYERLAARLRDERGLNVVVVTQDDFIADHGAVRSSDACFKRVMELVFGSEQCDVVILARNNACKQQYRKYADATPGRHIFIAPTECVTRSTKLLLPVCVASVMHRKKDATVKHPTDTMEYVDLAQLPLKFLASFAPSAIAHRVPFLRSDASVSGDVDWDVFMQPFLQASKKNKSYKTSLSGATLNAFSQTLQELDYDASLQARAPLEPLLQTLECIVLHALSHNGFLPMEQRYISIMLDEQSSEQVATLAASDSGSPVARPHVTLVHSLDTMREDGFERWVDAARSVRGAEVPLLVHRYKRAAGRLVVAEAMVPDEIAALVCSGVPHVTLKVQKGTKAHESKDVLRDDAISFIDLHEPLRLRGTVCITR